LPRKLESNIKTNERFDVTDKAFDETVAEMEPPGEDENAITYDSSEFLEEFIKKI
jgi:hypothetical protein